MLKNDRQEFMPPTNTQFELELDGDYSQYILYSKAEIRAVLRSVIQNGARITVHFDQNRSLFLTTMIALQPDNTGIVFDVGGSEEMNGKALKADNLIFTAFVDKVKIQFALDRLRRVEYQGRPAFIGAVPDQLLRLQRREFFLLSTPYSKPPFSAADFLRFAHF